MTRKVPKSRQSNANINKKGCSTQATVLPISNVPMEAMATTMAATMATTATAMAATSNPDPGDNANLTQYSVKSATTAKRKITSKLTVSKGRGIMLHWSKFKS